MKLANIGISLIKPFHVVCGDLPNATSYIALPFRWLTTMETASPLRMGTYHYKDKLLGVRINDASRNHAKIPRSRMDCLLGGKQTLAR